MAKSKSIVERLQDLMDQRDALNVAIMAIQTGLQRGWDKEELGEPEPEKPVAPVKGKKAAAAAPATDKPAKMQPNKAADKAAPAKKPPGAPPEDMTRKIVELIKSGKFSRELFAKMLDAAIKSNASEKDIHALRLAIQRFDLWDGDRKDLLTAYDEHEEDAKEIEIGKGNGQLSATKQAQVEGDDAEIPVGDEQDADADDDENQDDKF